MEILGIVITILWLFMGLMLVVQNQVQLNQMTIENCLIAFIILIVFAPCFLITGVLENILVWLGWEDNDDGHGV